MEDALKFAKWLNKENFCYSPFKPNVWISPNREHKHIKESIEYTTEQLFDEYKLLIKCNIIS